jgi:hypothetical protein
LSEILRLLYNVTKGKSIDFLGNTRACAKSLIREAISAHAAVLGGDDLLMPTPGTALGAVLKDIG